MEDKKKIVILGAGFAGIYSALAIKRELGDGAEITIVNKANHFLFTPLLHEVATGGIGHHQSVESIHQIVYKRKIKFLEGSVLSVDLAARTVQTDQGERSYDALVIAIGASTNFYDTPGASEHAFVLKDLSEAIAIRNHVITQFELASREKDPDVRKRMLSIVVVGGGATGTELAAELAEFSNHTLSKYYKCEFGALAAEVTLVQRGAELLPSFDEKVRSYAEKILKKKGVRILFDLKVKEVKKGSVALSNGAVIPSDTVVWTAGVKANTLLIKNAEFKKDASGRIITEPTLQVPGYPNVFALGDVAAVPGKAGTVYPMLAQIAVAEADMLGKNIARSLSGAKLEPFSYKLSGELVSLGQWEAAGTIFGIHLRGKLAWFIWRTVYLFKFISHSKKLKIAADWTVHIFFPRDVTKV